MSFADHAGSPFTDPELGVTERVADLLARMTVDEKVAQLGSAWVFQVSDADGLDTDRAHDHLSQGIGHITRISGASSLTAVGSAQLANDLQRHLRDHTRLGIPAIVHEEICSGFMARDAVTFPQAIGVASTFRPEHNRAIADAIRRQMRAVGAHHGLSPVLDIARDARWGRMEETYGEDAYLVARMGVAFIEGLQGERLTEGVVATAKHFVGYGAPEGGMNWAPAHLGDRELRDTYLRPFEHAVRDARLASVMNAYHELDGVPCGADRWLLTELLREEWGFDGTVVSDYFAIDQLHAYHRVVADRAGAAVLALNAGIDVELPNTDCYGKPLREAAERGEVDVADVDRAVARVLTAKFELGLFDEPLIDLDGIAAHTRTRTQLDLATRVARDSLVLVRNTGVLPLAAPTSMAVIGPNADTARNMLGDYSYVAHVESLVDLMTSGENVMALPIEDGAELDATTDLGYVTTVLSGLRERFEDTDITHVRGCDVHSEDRSQFEAAVAAATAAEVAVMVMGEKSGLTEECTTGESRDVTSLSLAGVQEDLVLAIAATGTPVVLVIVSGRPVGSPAVHDAAAAVLMAWLPGERGGAAIADALAGVCSPGGKLAVSHPRSAGQVPIYYGHKVSGGRSHWKGTYVDCSNEPLYPFGHGLTYSSFDVVADATGHAVAPSLPVEPGDVVDVGVTVTNTGDVDADEVVQLYSRDPVATIARPVLELQSFVRVSLASGASARLTFHVPVDALGFSGPDLGYVLEPGEVQLLVGTSSVELDVAVRVVIGGDDLVRTRRPLTRDVTVEPI